MKMLINKIPVFMNPNKGLNVLVVNADTLEKIEE
jgi:hypothetical protein